MALEMIMRPGLEGVIAAETRLSSIDGQIGELIIAGYPLQELAGNATFEETVYLLWHDRLPTESELADFRSELAQKRALPPQALDLLRAAAEKRVGVMDALRMATGALSLVSDGTLEGDSRLVVAAFPTIVAGYWRLLNGQDPVAPRTDLSHAANYLYMLTGEVPDDAQTRALETYLNTVVDHGFNASTFTARVIISTHSDMISAVVGAIGALKGPLHGGAPGPALDMVFEIGTIDRAEAYLREKLDKGEVLMGFGHRVYKVRDPRADALGAAADRFFTSGEKADIYTLAKQVEEVAIRLLDEYKPGRNLRTNVEFYTALLLYGIGLETDLFSPTFAVSRVAGWTAHALEHMRDKGRILRPRASYSGVKNRTWTAPNKR